MTSSVSIMVKRFFISLSQSVRLSKSASQTWSASQTLSVKVKQSVEHFSLILIFDWYLVLFSDHVSYHLQIREELKLSTDMVLDIVEMLQLDTDRSRASVMYRSTCLLAENVIMPLGVAIIAEQEVTNDTTQTSDLTGARLTVALIGILELVNLTDHNVLWQSDKGSGKESINRRTSMAKLGAHSLFYLCSLKLSLLLRQNQTYKYPNYMRVSD